MGDKIEKIKRTFFYKSGSTYNMKILLNQKIKNIGLYSVYNTGNTNN
ncbi:MAG: hypothetical protein ACOC33_00295 [bacterium]